MANEDGTQQPVGRGEAAPGVWRFAKASRVHVVIDAEEYFQAIRTAMLQARQRIMLIGWDFDTRISLSRTRRKKGDPPSRLGDFIVWLAERRPDLEIRVLKWNFGSLKMLGRGSTLVDLARWALHSNIDFKLDSAHPLGCSHHQKIVVIDDSFAVCGGIDMTSDRWDSRSHADDDVRRKRPNGTPYGPWHDATMMVEGEAAGALGVLARDRWQRAGGGEMQPCAPSDETAWPEAFDAEFADVTIGIARTRATHEGCQEIREIETLFLRQIAGAKRFIYAENQYFASRRIAEAIAVRMAEPDPPEIVIVNPLHADGWLEKTAMDSARVQLLRSIGEHDVQDRFSIFTPRTTAGAPIYVHAKLMIVDDRIIRVGSANMNNRSLGLDSECDAFIDCEHPGNDHCEAAIRAQRLDLLAEHCGSHPDDIAARIDRLGSMRAAIESFGPGQRRLERLDLQPLSDAEKLLADQAVLDPEQASEIFEPIASPGLFDRSRILNKPEG